MCMRLVYIYICKVAVFFEFHTVNLNFRKTLNWLDTENFLPSKQIDNVDLVYGSGYVSTGIWLTMGTH